MEPIAAASLGQVHRAVLWDGRTVAVKVQRPGLKALFDIDLAALRQIAAALDAQDSTRDFLSIYDECADVLYQEIDYVQEVRPLPVMPRQSSCIAPVVPSGTRRRCCAPRSAPKLRGSARRAYCVCLCTLLPLA